jgi:hypothetical protein
MDGLYKDVMEKWADSHKSREDHEAVELVALTGEWLEKLILDREIVNSVMRTLMCELGFGNEWEMNFDGDWREPWDWFSGEYIDGFPASELVLELNAYAFGGLRPVFDPEKRQGEGDLDRIARLVGLGRALADAIPLEWGNNHPDLDKTILAAKGRLSLDSGSDLTAHELAALARLSTKRIANMLARGDLKANAEGRIDFAEAKRWLETRSDFQASIWCLYEATERYIPAKEPELEDVLFVPATREGAIFDPASCRGSEGYTIGQKGSEQKFDDYLLALDRLSRMPTPFWRRPNSIGKRSTVAGASWVRKTRAELGLTDGADTGEA